MCDMHNNAHITQSLFPQSFLANSVPATIQRLSSLHPQFHKVVKSNKSLATAHAQNIAVNALWRHHRQRSHCQN